MPGDWFSENHGIQFPGQWHDMNSHEHGVFTWPKSTTQPSIKYGDTPQKGFEGTKTLKTKPKEWIDVKIDFESEEERKRSRAVLNEFVELYHCKEKGYKVNLLELYTDGIVEKDDRILLHKFMECEPHDI